MVKSSSSKLPIFSIIIPVYNDWVALERCLRAVAEQTNAPEFEVIVVDDGSEHSAPDWICNFGRFYPLKLISSCHSGIARSRNRGIEVSSGSAIIFTDADCRLEKNCLEMLAASLNSLPQHSYFQLHLIADCSNVVGQSEELRLRSLQEQVLGSTGFIRYLNTAGFAVRRSSLDVRKDLFEPTALRGEDTLLLANLMQEGKLPFFVSSAIVQHTSSLSPIACLKKEIRSARLEAPTFSIIKSMGVRFRVNHWDRILILASAWRSSRSRKAAWLLLVIRRIVRRLAGWSQTSTWMSVGPLFPKPSRSASTKESMEVGRFPGTPMLLARRTQSRSGLPIANMLEATGPGSPTPR
jgi:Glycosyl transferase family 2